ncbi:hypothetical protein PG999_004029 [Apiospora kogelbergensis]|uniref:Mtf2-like C-terminal domain-containing protein n=1 Tax=Apiospora kogelbergensis TaxID=1337665 RepID=A0AAW0R5B4_9PEZI
MSAPHLSFLYQTRTILSTRLPLNRSVARSLHTSRCFQKRDAHIPFESGVNVDDEVIPSKPKRTNTITPSERQTFDRIFADIAARGTIPQSRFEIPEPTPAARRSTNFIFNVAAIESKQKDSSHLVASPAQLAEASRDRNKALLRFPPSLRAAANRAFNILQPGYPSDDATDSIESASQGQAEEPPNSLLLRTAEMDAKRAPEEKRVNDLMEAARTDFELWDVLENEVFSLPAKFGLVIQADAQEKEVLEQIEIEADRQTKHLKKNKANSSRKRLIKQLTALRQKRELTDEELAERKQNMVQYGPLYPAFLLRGLRLLDTKFALPSRLALNVLPRVKELGLESFVLGVSTPFYNELLRIYYHRNGDLERMLDLLEEMRDSGLYFDGGTASVLNQVHHQTKYLAAGEFGPLGRVIMTMPEYEDSVRTRIGHWNRGVDLSIAQRRRDIVHSELTGRSL